MKTRLLKEFSALLPVWLVAVGLAVVPAQLMRDFDAFPLWLLLFGIGATLLSVESFGKEFANGTMNLLLSQPVTRRRLWNEKVLALLAAFVPVVGGFLVAMFWRSGSWLGAGDWDDAMIGLVAVVVCAFGGGLCMTVFFQQVAAGFWFTVLLPGAIVMITDAFREHYFPAAHLLPFWVLIVYGIFAGVAARFLFGRMQDNQWLGQEIAMPWFSRRKQVSVERRQKIRGPWQALFAKEIHLQQINFVVAGLFVALFLGLIGFKSLVRPEDSLKENSDLAVVGFLWLVVCLPFLVGAVSIAEERKLGSLGAQLTLPVSPLRQWGIKLVSVYLISFIVTVLLPSIISAIAHWLIPDEVQNLFQVGENLLLLAAIWFFGTAVAFYASSTARNLMHALSCVGSIIVLSAALYISEVALFGQARRSPLFLLNSLAVPVLWLVMIRLSAINFKRERLSAHDWRHNLIWFAAALASVSVLTAALYGRIWEKVLPEAKVHSNVALSGPVRAAIEWNNGCSLLLLPDGTLLQSKRTFDQSGVDYALAEVVEDFHPVAGHWWQLSFNWGIRADGTLWVWHQPADLSPALLRRYGLNLPPVPDQAYTNVDASASQPAATDNRKDSSEQTPIRMTRTGVNAGNQITMYPPGAVQTQIGADTNWTAVAAGSMHTLALKTDGTLWARGDNRWGQLGDGTSVSKNEFMRIGQDNDWTFIAVDRARETSYGIKRDGTLWEWGLSLEARAVTRAKGGLFSPPRRIENGRDWDRVIPLFGYVLGLKKDGTVWAWGQFPLAQMGIPGEAPIQLSGSDHWKTVSGNWGEVVAVRDDGTLWMWDQATPNPYLFVPRQISSRTNWVAVSTEVALSADGGLWVWGNSIGRNSFLNEFIPPSKRPHLVRVVSDQGAEPSK